MSAISQINCPEPSVRAGKGEVINTDINVSQQSHHSEDQELQNGEKQAIRLEIKSKKLSQAEIIKIPMEHNEESTPDIGSLYQKTASGKIFQSQLSKCKQEKSKPKFE